MYYERVELTPVLAYPEARSLGENGLDERIRFHQARILAECPVGCRDQISALIKSTNEVK
jgi:hypothetical protein